MLRSKFKNSALGGWTIRLVLACFAVRALIPIGYMPDVQVGAKGILKVVICTSAGAKSIAIDAQGKPAPSDKQTHHDQTCAFSGLATVTVASADGVALPPPDFTRSAPIVRVQDVLPPVRAGPVLGSRGPPQIS